MSGRARPSGRGARTRAPSPEDKRVHITTRELRLLKGRKARHLTLLSCAAIVLSLVSIPAYGIGPALALLLLAICAVQRRRGYDVSKPATAGVGALLISAISAGSCWWFFLRPAEVSGNEKHRQDRVERRFDDAFERMQAAPPPRDPPRAAAGDSARDLPHGPPAVDRSSASGTLDGSARFVDDAGNPGRSRSEVPDAQ